MKFFARILAAVPTVLSLGHAHALDRVLSAPRIKDNGDIRLSDDLKLGRFQRGKTTLTPDALAIQGPGSTGPIDGMSVTPSSSAPVGTASRFVFEALRGSTFYLRPSLSDLTCASDQTANINAAILTAPAGAQLILPPGCIAHSGQLLPAGRWLRGSGRAGVATELRYTGSSGAAIKVMGDGAQVSDLLQTNPVANSTAVAIQLADGVQNPRGQMVARVHVVGFQDQLDVQSGEFWSATNLDFYNATRYGIRIRNGTNPDSGDGSISASTIYADNPIGDTAIRLESGGGLRITTTKTLQFNKSFVLAVADGSNTSILMIDDSNSFENPRSSEAVHLGRIEGGATGNYGHINISAELAGAVGVYPGVENVRLAPMSRDVPYGITILGGNNITVTSATMLLRVDQALIIQDPATNVRVDDFNCDGCRLKIQDRRSVGAGRLNINEVRPVSLPAPAGNNPYLSLYEVSLASYRGIRLGIEVEGLMQGAGTVNSVADVLAIHTGSAVPAPTAVAPQVNAGAASIDIQYDTATTPGAVRIGVRVPPSYKTSTFAGSITLKIDGRVNALKVLP